MSVEGRDSAWVSLDNSHNSYRHVFVQLMRHENVARASNKTNDISRHVALTALCAVNATWLSYLYINKKTVKI